MNKQIRHSQSGHVAGAQVPAGSPKGSRGSPGPRTAPRGGAAAPRGGTAASQAGSRRLPTWGAGEPRGWSRAPQGWSRPEFLGELEEEWTDRDLEAQWGASQRTSCDAGCFTLRAARADRALAAGLRWRGDGVLRRGVDGDGATCGRRRGAPTPPPAGGGARRREGRGYSW